MIVIGNGDVKDNHQAQLRLNQSGCDAVMIGRAATGRPWVFSKKTPDQDERLMVIREHLMLETQKRGEAHAMAYMRKILAAYVHGMPGAAKARARIFKAADFETVWRAIQDIFMGMEEGEAQ